MCSPKVGDRLSWWIQHLDVMRERLPLCIQLSTSLQDE
jgi:hypothetical protein